ncbi:hypothetical protein RI543_005083 [Arxiozyma heterogenica]|uniref:Uncharacterized protein n=1 Tax=Arxiozyma heterogenica TaxID=278026 RepID=A0AAN7ZWP6_9SACH|nr:hypothetical protein RI543_005083 [Kazachstania heterogenica]
MLRNSGGSLILSSEKYIAELYNSIISRSMADRSTPFKVQQVMSLVATAAGCIPIKLSGKKNFKRWITILAMHMSDINLHWYQYAQNGKLNVIIEQYNPSNYMIAYIKKNI